MDKCLKFDAHINKIFKNCMYHLRNIFKIRRYLTTEACKLLIHALVTSRLDYCNSLLYGCNKSSVHCLQLIQNYAARLIYKVPKFYHITPYLKDLHWLPVHARIKFKILTIVFKCIHGNGPSYLSDLTCRKTVKRPGLRSQLGLLLEVPRTVSRATLSKADGAFSIARPKLWNDLPAPIQNCTRFDIFKFKLQTFQFRNTLN